MAVPYRLIRIGLEDARESAVREGIAAWRSLLKGRLYPTRTEIDPRDFKNVLSNMILLRVVDGGADYEYRIVGEEHRRIHDLPEFPRKLSDLDKVPGDANHRYRDYAAIVKRLYDEVLSTRVPFAARGWIDRGSEELRYVASESAFLPLGDSADCVDHILIFSKYSPTALHP